MFRLLKVNQRLATKQQSSNRAENDRKTKPKLHVRHIYVTGLSESLYQLNIQGASVNRAILRTSRTVNAFIYIVLTTYEHSVYIKALKFF
jgi:hypothetical protein